ncbi:double zinc ribbon domain-containing protein [Methanobacterium sp.]|uniref:zinc ribbon domain-containing protein n=1 Tax=Methanobacterium sp. TaxID=2164 RepID=UPI003C788911
MTKECSKCGAQVAENVKFCTECGSKMELDVPKCPSCSTELPEGTKFCMECGTKVGDAPRAKPEIKKAPKEVTCPRCRKKFPAGTKFCKECGTPIRPKISKERKPEDEVDKIIKEATTTGKGLLKEADSLLKRFR